MSTIVYSEQERDGMTFACYVYAYDAEQRYDAAQALKQIDPIAYRCGLLDWLDREGWVEAD